MSSVYYSRCPLSYSDEQLIGNVVSDQCWSLGRSHSVLVWVQGTITAGVHQCFPGSLRQSGSIGFSFHPLGKHLPIYCVPMVMAVLAPQPQHDKLRHYLSNVIWNPNSGSPVMKKKVFFIPFYPKQCHKWTSGCRDPPWTLGIVEVVMLLKNLMTTQ